MRSSGQALAHWSQTMQVCAPVPGSVWRRRTPRKRGAVGRRSAGYWNVNAGCGVYFNVTHRPFSRSTRKMVLKKLMMVCISVRSAEASRYVDVRWLTTFAKATVVRRSFSGGGSLAVTLRAFSDDDWLALPGHDHTLSA